MVDQRAPTFGQLLRRFRQAAGITQEMLGRQAGLSARGISDLERGARQAPHPYTIRKLADALGLRDPDRVAFEAAARRRPGLFAAPAGGSAHNLPAAATSFIALVASVLRNGASTSAITFIARSLWSRESSVSGMPARPLSLPRSLTVSVPCSLRGSSRRAIFRCLPSSAWNNSLARLA